MASLPVSTAVPQGCGSGLNSLYYRLCDLSAVWGIVVEAFATAGVLASLVLLMVLLASLPFVSSKKRRSSVGINVAFLVCALGLFGLAFAFIVGLDFSTCTSRRFLFGVLFAGSFSCLLMQAVKLNILARRDSGPAGWVLCLGALGLWLVEVIINTEWMIITMVRYPLNDSVAGMTAQCAVENKDFVMALIYVMNLLLAVVMAPLPALAGKHKRWRKDSIFILLTGLLSVGIWVAWIVMYIYGNATYGRPPLWDDPTLAIALVANAWVFLLLYTVPEVCYLTEEDEVDLNFGQDIYPKPGVGYETILKDQSSQSVFMENKAFSMDEPNSGNKPVSPYSGYNGQIRSSVYQPTELALITKGAANVSASLSHFCFAYVDTRSGRRSQHFAAIWLFYGLATLQQWLYAKASCRADSVWLCKYVCGGARAELCAPVSPPHARASCCSRTARSRRLSLEPRSARRTPRAARPHGPTCRTSDRRPPATVTSCIGKHSGEADEGLLLRTPSLIFFSRNLNYGSTLLFALS